MDALRLGLIGAGRWGRAYIKTIGGIEGVRLARLASRNPESRSLVPATCEISPDWHAVAGADDLDGVIIAAPPALHAEMAKACVAAGLPVLVEKPLTLRLAEAEDLFAFVEERGGLVVVDHTHLFHPAYRELKRRARDLGTVRAITARAGAWGPFRQDTPVLWDWGPHDVAMCIDLAGRLPVEVSARRVETMETEDGPGETVAISLGFPGGIEAHVTVGNILPEKTRTFAVEADGQALIFEDRSRTPLVLETFNAKGDVIGRQVVRVSPEPPLSVAVKEFAAAVRGRSKALSSLRLGLDVVSVLERCQADLDAE